jgi:hypothetical protein
MKPQILHSVNRLGSLADMSLRRYELGFYIPEDDILHSYRCEHFRSYRSYQILDPAELCSGEVMCLLWSTKWVFISQKTAFFLPQFSPITQVKHNLKQNLLFDIYNLDLPSQSYNRFRRLFVLLEPTPVSQDCHRGVWAGQCDVGANVPPTMSAIPSSHNNVLYISMRKTRSTQHYITTSVLTYGLTFDPEFGHVHNKMTWLIPFFSFGATDKICTQTRSSRTKVFYCSFQN